MEIIKFKHFKKALTCQPFFIWHNLEDEGEIEEDDLLHFWNVDIEDAPTTAQQVLVKTFGFLENHITKLILDNYDAVVLVGSIEERVEKTKEYIGSDKVVLGAAFEYKGAYSSPLAFDFENGHIFERLFSGKTKRKDMIKAYYQYEVIKHTTPINDYILFLPTDAETLKGEIEISTVNRITPTKTGSYPEAVTAKGELKSVPIMSMLESGTISKTMLPSFDTILERITSSEDAELTDQLSFDATFWGDNPQWKELLVAIGHPLAGYSGNIQKKKKIAENEPIDSPTLELLSKIDEPTVLEPEFARKMLDQLDGDVVWYDFEGFSLPYAAVDYTKPHRQQVFQVSVITTQNLKEDVVDNLVWDPMHLSYKDFYEIIEAVYQGGKDKYVVYNKGYEIPRMRDMLKVIVRYDQKMFEEASRMLEHISENTVDLMDLFKWSGKKTPSILLHDQGGFASIKNIEKHISANNVDVGYSIKEYKKLDVQNGYMAMELAIKRATGVVGDNEWKVKEPFLKEYCENDVRMMIMVYYFVKHLLNK